jgi:hypothetical protein
MAKKARAVPVDRFEMKQKPHEKKMSQMHDMLYGLSDAARVHDNKNLPAVVRKTGKAAIKHIGVMHKAMKSAATQPPLEAGPSKDANYPNP